MCQSKYEPTIYGKCNGTLSNHLNVLEDTDGENPTLPISVFSRWYNPAGLC